MNQAVTRVKERPGFQNRNAGKEPEIRIRASAFLLPRSFFAYFPAFLIQFFFPHPGFLVSKSPEFR
jgi:hypothetical protein